MKQNAIQLETNFSLASDKIYVGQLLSKTRQIEYGTMRKLFILPRFDYFTCDEFLCTVNCKSFSNR